MKVYIVSEDDINRLILAIDRNPKFGQSGGSNRGGATEEQLKAEEEAHKFINRQVRLWIREIGSERLSPKS